MGKLTDIIKRTLRADSLQGANGLQAINGSWLNPVNGLGLAGSDPTAQLAYGGGTIPLPSTLRRLYTSDWAAERAIEKLPATAMVRGFELAGGDNEELLRDFRELNFSDRFPRGAFQEAVYQGRAYGGARLLLGYALGSPQSPLTDTHRAGGVQFLDVIPQHQLRVLARYSSPGDPDFGMPSLYEIIDDGHGPRHPRTGQRFHASRSIHFTGKPLRLYNGAAVVVEDVTGTLAQPELGVSVLTPMLMVLGRYGLAWSSVNNMLADKSVGWMKMGGLVEALAEKDSQYVQQRMSILQAAKSIHRLMFLDADNEEEFGRTEINLAEVPQILQQYMIELSGSAGVPARIFFENPPSALNAGSANESDFTAFYNTCDDLRATYLGPKLEETLTAVNGGNHVEVKWPTLWEASDNEKAQTRLARWNATKVAWDMGAVEASDAAKAAREGVDPETISNPNDDRAEVTNPGGDVPSGPQGAPGSDQAGDIASQQRKEESSER